MRLISLLLPVVIGALLLIESAESNPVEALNKQPKGANGHNIGATNKTSVGIENTASRPNKPTTTNEPENHLSEPKNNSSTWENIPSYKDDPNNEHDDVPEMEKFINLGSHSQSIKNDDKESNQSENRKAVPAKQSFDYEKDNYFSELE